MHGCLHTYGKTSSTNFCEGNRLRQVLYAYGKTSFTKYVVQATVCAKFGLQCIVYMGAKDMERQKLNVFRMRLLGAEVRPVKSGTSTLKDATSEAIRDWVTNVETTHYILGSAAGPHPYPMMVSLATFAHRR